MTLTFAFQGRICMIWFTIAGRSDGSSEQTFDWRRHRILWTIFRRLHIQLLWMWWGNCKWRVQTDNDETISPLRWRLALHRQLWVPIRHLNSRFKILAGQVVQNNSVEYESSAKINSEPNSTDQSCQYEEDIANFRNNAMNKIWIQGYDRLSKDETGMLEGLQTSPVAFGAHVSDHIFWYSGGKVKRNTCTAEYRCVLWASLQLTPDAKFICEHFSPPWNDTCWPCHVTHWYSIRRVQGSGLFYRY